MTKPRGLNRLPIVAVAIFLLLAAMWAGLLRMGWHMPPLSPVLAGIHGPLMVSGFLGTLISLERSVGVGKAWTYMAPIATGLGALGLLFGLPVWLAALLISFGSLVQTAVFIYITSKQPAMHSVVMTVATILWFIGNLLWLFGFGIPTVVPWWAGYLVLTIAGERLELSRLLFLSETKQRLFYAAVAVLVIGLVTVVVWPILGWRVVGLGFVAIAAWLLTNDIARRTIQQQGLTKFIAACMLSGYVWLSVGGILAIVWGFLYGGRYDAVLHSIFLGFVMGMIFGHAPVIFPSVLGVQMPFRSAFYGHLALLDLSLFLRVGGDLIEWYPAQKWGAMLNVFAVLFFLGNTLLAIRAGFKLPRRPIGHHH
jgi:hypothetical protein